MRSMGRGRALAYAVIWGLGTLTLGAHIATRDSILPPAIVQNQIKWRDDHLEIVGKSIGALEQESAPQLALLLGGSNIVYGLSAEILSSTTGASFFNLGLFKEGYSFDRYLAFSKRALAGVQIQDVDLVVYSTVDFFRSDISRIDAIGFDEAGMAITEIGARSSLLPATPILTRVQDQFSTTTNTYRVRGERGDIDLGYIDCSGGVRIPNEAFDATFAAEFSGILLERVLRVLDTFPNARIVVTVPPRFIAARQLQNSEIGVYSEKLSKHGIEFIVEEPFENGADLCNAAHHPNEGGRAMRTSALARELVEFGIFD